MGALDETFTLANGVAIPKVGFGTWQTPTGAVAYQAVATALEVGFRHLDTAFAYGNEASVGRAVRDSGLPREQIFVTSKLPAEVKSFDDALRHFEQTQTNLGLGYVDLYLIHAPWPWSRIGQSDDEGNLAAWQALQQIYANGHARAIGVSNFDVHDMQNLLEQADTAPMVNQIQYYVGFTEPKITAFAREHGMLVEAYSPLATGDILGSEAVRKVAAAHEVSVAQVAIRFCLQNGVLPLPKAIAADHIRTDAALDFTLSDDELRTLNELPDAAPAHAAYHNATQG
jgi:diketogulonate reductase-like aldo/keto reductase